MRQNSVPNKTVAIFGATSDIAVAVGRRYAGRRSRLVLIARDVVGGASVAADLRVRGAADTAVLHADLALLEEPPTLVGAAWDHFGGIDVALIAYGIMPSQQEAERDPPAAAKTITVNLTSPAILLNELARRFQLQGHGTIAAITSVAGDRRRMSNYKYGAAKGGFQRLLEGLRHRLARFGIAVVDIRLGFVTTRLTAHLERNGPLWTGRERVAADVVAAIEAGQAVCYTPKFWRLIMAVVRMVPRVVFHRTSL